MALKIPSASGNGKSGQPQASSLTEFLSPFVNLLEFLSSCSGEGNSKRVVGDFSLTTKFGKWTARLKDHQGGVYCYVTAIALDDVLQMVEQGLGDGSLDWREDQQNGKPYVKK